MPRDSVGWSVVNWRARVNVGASSCGVVHLLNHGPVYEMLRFSNNLEECRKVQFAKRVTFTSLASDGLVVNSFVCRLPTGSLIQVFLKLLITLHKRLVDRRKRQSHTLWPL